jgi:hypothetical protein
MARIRRVILSSLVAGSLALGLVVMGMQVASAANPPSSYFNGFETNTAGWFNFSGATITRRPSGYLSSGYASGISSASGNYHARLGKDPSPDSCTFGGGTAPIYYGPYTNWGGYSNTFPTGGYQTGVDIYLDVPYAMSHPDTRFDWSSAINTPSGNHRRDFVFNAGTDPLGFVISGGNNANRCGANPSDPGHAPTHITLSGWYSFRHIFSGVPGGPLVVTMQILDSNDMPVPGATWVRTDPSDIIGVTVGGNRYGWFVQNEFDDLAIDNSFRASGISTPLCNVDVTNGGWIIADNGDKATFGGNAKVSPEGFTSGQEQYQDHGPAQEIRVKSLTVTNVTCSDDQTHATITGFASVDGSGEHPYQIDVSDMGPGGSSDTYRIQVFDIAYDSGEHTLGGGNVTIHT